MTKQQELEVAEMMRKYGMSREAAMRIVLGTYEDDVLDGE